MAHVHAALMLQYAQDAAETDTPWERWEIKINNGEWCELNGNPNWVDYWGYRRKSKVCHIGGIEIPTPLREEPTEGYRYYYITFRRHTGSVVNEFSTSYADWRGTFDDFRRLWSNICHLSKDAATAHANALNEVINHA